MAVTSASLSELESFYSNLSTGYDEINSCLTRYKQIVEGVSSETEGGTQSIADSVIMGVGESLKDVEVKISTLKGIVKNIIEIKKQNIAAGAQDAQNITYNFN